MTIDASIINATFGRTFGTLKYKDEVCSLITSVEIPLRAHVVAELYT